MLKAIEKVLIKDKEIIFKNYRYRVLGMGDYLIASLAALVCLVIYAVTLTPSISSGDNGELTVAAHYLGVAHAPGYPLHSLFGKLATFLAFSNIAWRINFFSALCGAIFVFFSTLVLFKALDYFSFKKLERYFAALIGGVSLGLAPAIWSQSTIAEVYTQSSIFLPILFLLLLKWGNHVISREGYDLIGERYLLALALLFGFALGGHHTILLTEIFIVFFILIICLFQIFLPLGLKRSLEKIYLLLGVLAFYAIAWVLYYKYIMSLDSNIFADNYANLKKGLYPFIGINALMILYYVYMRYFYSGHKKDNVMIPLSMIVVKCFLFLYIGFSIYIYLFIRSHASPPINWGGISEESTILSKLAKFFHIIHRKQYPQSGMEMDLNNSIMLISHTFSPIISRQFSYPLWGFCLVGIGLIYRKSLFLFTVLLLAFITYTFQLTFFLKFRLSDSAFVTAEIFYVFSYLTVSVPIAIGCALFLSYCRHAIDFLFSKILVTANPSSANPPSEPQKT